jgi:hypothetical protein
MSQGIYQTVSTPRVPAKRGIKTSAGKSALSTDQLDFVERMSRAGVGALFFGHVYPMFPDTSHTRQMLFRTTYLNRRFLAPVGLKMSILHHEAVLSGSVSNRVAASLASLLASLIPGVEEVRDETVYDESALRVPTGKTTKLPVLNAMDGLLRDELLATLEMDQNLGAFSYEIEVTRTGLRVNATLPDETLAARLHTLINGLRESPRILVNVTLDSETDLATRRRIRPDEDSIQTMVEFRLRQTVAWPKDGLKIKANSTTLQLSGRMENPLHRELAVFVAGSTSGVTVVDAQFDY